MSAGREVFAFTTRFTSNTRPVKTGDNHPQEVSS